MGSDVLTRNQEAGQNKSRHLHLIRSMASVYRGIFGSATWLYERHSALTVFMETWLLTPSDIYFSINICFGASLSVDALQRN